MKKKKKRKVPNSNVPKSAPVGRVYFHSHEHKQTNRHLHSRMEVHKQTPTLACNRDSGEETDRGKPLERQITGLDKLHFCCDHESYFDVPLVFRFLQPHPQRCVV